MRSHVALTFHGLGEPHGGVDAAERAYWFSHDEFRAIVARIAQECDLSRVIVTFDDGNASDLAAAEILAEHGIKGFSFVLAGRLGAPHYLAAADLRQLADMGITIGLHGHDHVDWRSLDDAGLRRELAEARAVLADALGAAIEHVAIPLGRYDRRVMRQLHREGFAHIHTSDWGRFDPAERVWNRNTIWHDPAGQDLASALRGDQSLLRKLRGRTSQLLRRHVL